MLKPEHTPRSGSHEPDAGGRLHAGPVLGPLRSSPVRVREAEWAQEEAEL